jgi:hypothetical protein
VLSLMKYLDAETDYAVWAVAASALERAMSLIVRSGNGVALGKLEGFVRRRVETFAARLGWADGNTAATTATTTTTTTAAAPLGHLDALVRPIVQRLAVAVGAGDARAQALQLWEQLGADTSGLVLFGFWGFGILGFCGFLVFLLNPR